jgi:hypothetical protein
MTKYVKHNPKLEFDRIDAFTANDLSIIKWIWVEGYGQKYFPSLNPYDIENITISDQEELSNQNFHIEIRASITIHFIDRHTEEFIIETGIRLYNADIRGEDQFAVINLTRV